jgi:transposase
MKTLLTLASISAIQCDKELKYYYRKKVAEGKPKMVALNNVRNKILSRAFAVVKRGHRMCQCKNLQLKKVS